MEAEARRGETREQLLQAASAVLSEHGYAGLSTRRVAEAAGTPMSQIQYHFGSKEGLILALFEDMNAALLNRQQAMFDDPSLPLSRQWELACDFLEDDLNSGYVRILQELIAAGWSTPSIRRVATEGLNEWHRLLVVVARRAEKRLGSFSPFTAEELATLVSDAFLGAEAQLLLGREDTLAPHRKALRRVGALIASLEARSG
jgi:AcrR family transcriptional regulator